MRRRMAYNALLQSLSGQTSAPSAPPSALYSAPLSVPFSAPSANLPTPVAPLSLATTSTTTSVSNYEYMPLLKQGDYLQLRFWDKSSFVHALSGKNATTFGSSSNVAKIETTDYLEDENGIPLTEQRRSAMYSHARRFWNTYLQKSGRFPPTYSALDLDTLGHFRSEMERHFFELRLCDNHWKVDEIWICNYHSWRSGAERQPGMAKTEACNDSVPVVKKERPRPRPRKRKLDRSPSIPAKTNDQSTSGDAIVVPDTEVAPIDSDPQVMASSAFDSPDSMPPSAAPPTSHSKLSASDTLDSKSMLPTSHSSASHISISPSLSSVTIESDAVMSPPVSNNNILGSDTALPVVPIESGPLPTSDSCPLLKSSSHVPPTQLSADNHLPDTSQVSAVSADDETLSAARSLFSLAQPVDGKSSQRCCCVVTCGLIISDVTTPTSNKETLKHAVVGLSSLISCELSEHLSTSSRAIPSPL